MDRDLQLIIILTKNYKILKFKQMILAANYIKLNITIPSKN